MATTTTAIVGATTTDATRYDDEAATAVEVIDDDALGLHLLLHHGWLGVESSAKWWNTIIRNTQWFRVCYKSARFGNECETPCFTAFFGGFEQFRPYQPVPCWLRPLLGEVSAALGAPFNALLLRLYFDGADEIAWHTDGRTFLGDSPTIASLSLGAAASFQMRRMLDCWNGADVSVLVSLS
jgi:hypothetical protein